VDSKAYIIIGRYRTHLLSSLSFLIFAVYLLCLAGNAHAVDASFSWVANPESVDGYRIYYKSGTSGAPYNGTGATEGPSPVTTGNVTNFTLHGLSESETYYFTITAYIGSVESGYAKEVVLLPVGSDSVDNDGDGFTPAGGDCNDSNRTINPGAVDIANNGIDENCDGADRVETTVLDNDGDGFTPAGGDCNDTDDTMYPNAIEVCEDGIDNDCDGLTDEDCDVSCPDVDGDRYRNITCGGTDCNDNDELINPGATEICDTIDNNCNSQIDESSTCESEFWKLMMPVILDAAAGTTTPVVVSPDCANPRARADLSGCNFSGLDLSGLQLYKIDLSNTNLSNALLVGTQLESATISSANLQRANLSTARLVYATLSNSNLTRAILSGANMYAAIVNGANLSFADLTGANLSGATFNGSTMTGADLSGANMANGKFTGVNFTDAILTGANAEGNVINYNGATWSNTTCPDGTNSDNNGGTCVNNR
jgi:uncharacterized protein YjbI with pentapeptide repeats